MTRHLTAVPDRHADTAPVFTADACTANPGLCGRCAGLCAVVDHGPPDPLLALPTTMRTSWPMGCRGCGGWIPERGVCGLRAIATGNAWACAACLGPELIPAPRAPETDPEQGK